MPELQCEETLPEVPVKLAAMQPSPATLFHRMVQRRLTQGQAAPGHRARRRLFSAVDPDEVSRFVKRELACIRAADRRRYNFDFDKMLPLEGRFQWERVGAALTPCENTPSPLLHRSARRLELDCPRSEAASCHGELRSGDTDTKTSAAPHVTCPEKDRVGCLLNGDAPSQTLNETSQSRRGRSQDSCLHSRSAGGKLATTRLRQTALTGENFDVVISFRSL